MQVLHFIVLFFAVIKCKRGWKSIRTCFLRHLNPKRNKLVSRYKPYYLESRLQFLLPFLKPASFDINEVAAPEDDDNEDDNDDKSSLKYIAPPSAQPSPLAAQTKLITKTNNKSTTIQMKRKHQEIPESDKSFVSLCKQPNTSDSPRKQFLFSLLPDLESMSEQQFRLFRRKVLFWVDEILDPSHSVSKQERLSM